MKHVLLMAQTHYFEQPPNLYVGITATVVLLIVIVIHESLPRPAGTV